MVYEAKKFDNLLGVLGFSDQLLKNHFTLYEGYVANTNKVISALSSMAKEGKTADPQYAEPKRRFGWEFNGMRLHELYFSNMAKGGSKKEEAATLMKMIAMEFGSYEQWESEFKSVGAMRGIGWVILYYDISAKKLFNCWINEHDSGHLSSCAPIIVMDVFEHAYMIDYGLKKADYIISFMKAIDWKVAERRISLVSD